MGSISIAIICPNCGGEAIGFFNFRFGYDGGQCTKCGRLIDGEELEKLDKKQNLGELRAVNPPSAGNKEVSNG